MNLSARILGRGTVEDLTTRAAAPLLTLGRDTFYRRDLAKIDCFNFLAAANLSKHCADLGVTSTQDVFDRLTPTHFARPGLGAIALAVLGAAFQVKKLGGSQPLEAWFMLHRAKEQTREFVTFTTVKHAAEARDKAAEKQARKTARTRKQTRRDTAHRLRVDRFTTRTTTKAEDLRP